MKNMSHIDSIFNDREIFCLAPFISLYFRLDGRVTPCCSSTIILGKYPKNTIEEIWNGQPLRKIKTYMCDHPIRSTFECDGCFEEIRNGNFKNSRIVTFDGYSLNKIDAYNYMSRPKIFSFELSNICNYECIMCKGNWSSSIRKNRDNLPPIISPYNENFREQLKEFYPQLKICNFLGGEPLLNNLNYEIIEDIQKINSNIRIVVTSNGSVMNNRIKRMITNSSIKFVISLDGFTKHTYESIRKGGNFENVMSNVDFLLKNNHLGGISTNPMIQNWREIPMILKFCQDNSITCYFNNVTGMIGEVPISKNINIPKNEMIERLLKLNLMKRPGVSMVSLFDLPKFKLQEILNYYSKFSFIPNIQSNLTNLMNKIQVHINENRN